MHHLRCVSACLVFSIARQELICSRMCVQIPIGAEDRFEGVVDLVRMKGITWDGEVSPAHNPVQVHTLLQCTDNRQIY